MQHFLTGLAGIPAVAVYGFVFVWLALESAGLPVPNELVLLLCGSIAAQRGHTNLFPPLLVLIATVGSLLGAFTSYTIGFRGGRPLVLRIGRRLRLDEARLDRVEAWFARSGIVAIFLARITPFVRTVASYPAGMLRYPLRSFLGASFLGSLLWCAVMVGLGHAFGANYQVALRLIEEYTIPAILVLAALVAGYFWLHARLAHIGGKGALTPEQVEALRERERR
ncbi:MAG TPA: DedA family protein [Ktedonobacterales bacterium]|nr:DedA family protein [Ktedonobacterales bacterium]